MKQKIKEEKCQVKSLDRENKSERTVTLYIDRRYNEERYKAVKQKHLTMFHVKQCISVLCR